jgi:putative transposase
MKRSRFTDEQIAYALRQVDGGTAAADVCRQMGISDATFYVWKKKYAKLGSTDIRELRQLREENAQLKRLVERRLSNAKGTIEQKPGTRGISKLSPRDVERWREGIVRPRLGSLKYAATKIGCSLPTLYDLIEAGKLRSYHIGRAHRVSEQAVADCIALLERESAQERAARSPPRAGSRRPLAE